MSKIFDALQKLDATLPGLDLPALTAADPESLIPTPEPLIPTPQPLIPNPQPLIPTPISLRIPAHAPILPFDGTNAAAGEQYRIVRTKIIQHPLRPRMLLISSAGPGDGKTVSSINLAGALALKADSSVLLVNGDFRRSSIPKLLGIPPTPGLAEVLRGTCPLQDAVLQTEQFPKLHILCAGESLSNPSELLDSPAWTSLAALLRKQYSYVVLDAPPVGAVADYDLLQAACDGVILVVRPDHTNRGACKRSLEAVPKEKLLGILLNCYQEWFLWRNHHNYYYYHRSN